MTLSISPIAAAVDVFAPLDAATIIGHLGQKSGRSVYPDHTTTDDDDDDKDTKAHRAPSYTGDAEALAVADNQSDARRSRKHVRFDEADVLEFEPSAWTATVASDGIPVGMSNTLRRRTRRRLDSFENERCLWRVRREEYMEHGYLEPDERLEILESAGLSAAVLSHVEKETIRINRERWESNEYDLMYQFGLGEVPVMEMSEDEGDGNDDEDDVLFLATPDSHDEDCGLMQLDDSDDCGSESNQGDGFYYSARNVLADAEVRFAMEEMDAYDTRRYEELNVDYAVDCILGDDSDSAADENNELPYAKDSFESPLSFALPEMSSSPTDVSAASECMIVSCSPLRAGAHAAVLVSGEPKMFRI
ncbi:hypothetical protein PybrP1_011387 [[Pythium] brassicae (nom. inval.)]|nr:hypothetical protein PybrP1_011387 [[Pythium] brassicae (nom. inval.)]